MRSRKNNTTLTRRSGCKWNTRKVWLIKRYADGHTTPSIKKSAVVFFIPLPAGHQGADRRDLRLLLIAKHPAEVGPRRKEQNTMMIEEFEQRTGYPLCRIQGHRGPPPWSSVETGRVLQGVQRKTPTASPSASGGSQCSSFRESRQHAADLTRRDIEIGRLKKQLEREQEWKPYEDADAVRKRTTTSFRHLGRHGQDDRRRGKGPPYNWYGFAKEMVVIPHRSHLRDQPAPPTQEVGAVDRAPPTMPPTGITSALPAAA